MELDLKISKQTDSEGNPYLSIPRTELRNFIKDFPDGYSLLVKITDQRSLGKNAALHGYIKIIANEIGEPFDYMKVWLVCKFFGHTEREEDGVVYKIPCSTSKLSNKEFGIGLNNLYIWAKEELNVNLPNSDIIHQLLK